MKESKTPYNTKSVISDVLNQLNFFLTNNESLIPLKGTELKLLQKEIYKKISNKKQKPKIKFLYKVGDTYYFRKKIDNKVYRKSLKTKSFTKALKYYNILTTLTNEELLEMFKFKDGDLEVMIEYDTIEELKEIQKMVMDYRKERVIEPKSQPKEDIEQIIKKVLQTEQKIENIPTSQIKEKFDYIKEGQKAIEHINNSEIKDSINFEELEIRFVSHKRKFADLKETSFRNYSATFNKLKAFFKELSISKIDRKELEKFQDWLVKKEKVSNKTVNDHLNYVKNFFDFAIKMEILEKNPCNYITKLPETKNKGRAVNKKNYTDEQALMIMNGDFEQEYKNLFKLLFYTGMRYGEAIYVQPRHVKERNGIKYIDLDISKTENGIREIPLHKEIENLQFPIFQPENKKAFLDLNVKENEIEYLRFKKNNGKNSLRRLYTLIEKGQGQAQHEMRATMIGKLINIFPDKIAVIQDIVGHGFGDNSLTIKTYGKGFSLELKNEILQALQYTNETNEFNFEYDTN